jgi:hypothetical protein
MSLLSIRRSEKKFMGEEFDTMEEFHARVKELLDQLTPETTQRVDEHRIKRLPQIIHTNGDYIQSQVSP